MATHAIELIHLARRFGRTEAVHDLTLTVPAGSVSALLGPNGAGKTTTIKVIMNLLRPTSGEARVLGVDSRKLRPRELAQIGFVSEEQQLPAWMTVRQFLDYCRPFYPTWDRDLEKKLLERFELPPARKLKHLSRGMRMKAALLSSLAYRPKLLVLDEPFSGLDPVVRDDFVRGVLEATGSGDWTVFVSSHDIEEVERLCDRIALIDAGRLQLAESTDSLLNRFRRVEAVWTDQAPVPAKAAPEAAWLDWQHDGARVSFVDTQYDRAAGKAVYSSLLPDAAVTAQPMTLREIFIALARSKRPEGGAIRNIA